MKNNRDQIMKVYAVIYNMAYEGSYIKGIYDTLEKAKKAKKRLEKSLMIGNDWVGIEEFEVK